MPHGPAAGSLHPAAGLADADPLLAGLCSNCWPRGEGAAAPGAQFASPSSSCLCQPARLVCAACGRTCLPSVAIFAVASSFGERKRNEHRAGQRLRASGASLLTHSRAPPRVDCGRKAYAAAR